jgi:hypothetical protein
MVVESVAGGPLRIDFFQMKSRRVKGIVFMASSIPVLPIVGVMHRTNLLESAWILKVSVVIKGWSSHCLWSCPHVSHRSSSVESAD